MNKATLFMYGSWIGPIGIAILVINAWVSPDNDFYLVGALGIIIGSIILLVTRNADEFTRSLWNAGASTAFGSLIILVYGLPFAEGMYDGFTDQERRGDLDSEAVVILAIAAFYVGLFWKRIRGGV